MHKYLAWFGLLLTSLHHASAVVQQQLPLLQHAQDGRNVSAELFAELEELARVVDISYCVGVTGLGISRPFSCFSRCTDFPRFELVTTWNTGPLLSDSCGYIALDHDNRRILVAFRGTYSIANTIMDLSTVPQEYVPYPGSDEDGDGTATPPRCQNCTVHMGFHASWLNTRQVILPHLSAQSLLHPSYHLHLVGHSLGGAVAALAGLDLLARRWDPTVTTFGEPRIGNTALSHFLDSEFGLLPTSPLGPSAVAAASPSADRDQASALRYRRVTHVDDPVPLLPLTEWGYAMHAGEIHISKSALSPDIPDLRLCGGDADPQCIARQDATLPAGGGGVGDGKRDVVGLVRREMLEGVRESWGIPSRYRLWELFFAHRDYFWRLGLCVPGGDPLGGGGKYGNSSHGL